MNFRKRTLNSRRIKTTYTKKRTYTKKKSSTKWLVKFLFYTITFFFVLSGIMGVVLYNKYIAKLPSINELENLEIAESTTIYDREGGELYKIYKEKRTYIPYENINKNMVNAIVAGEDKRYWENPGVDIIGIVRAVIYRVIGKSKKVEGTSTLTQQLIRNTIISIDEKEDTEILKKVERKIKEIYLSYKLSAGVSKEKILELYLNKISFGHNAYGIEQAAKTFFGKKASELGIMESSVLASLPKGPTYYSPYNHTDRVMGYPYFYLKDNSDEVTKIITPKDKETNNEILNKLYSFINELKTTRLEGTDKALICNLKKEYFKNNLRIDNDGCTIIEYSSLLNFLNGIRIQDGDYFIEYQTGRKDFILGRMLEDKYIKFDDYKEALLDSFGYSFASAKEEIKAPHFVFFVKEYLEKNYGEEVVESGGLKVYTTLDPKLQKKAEEIVEKYSKINSEKFAADNAALISIDNNNGNILSMVGGRDYFDKDNNGNVNIITSKLQPGSTFKPFVYSLGMYNNEIGTKTPIYDLETDFPSSYTPSNFDGKFMGKIDISTALNNSRNIPAIKMFYMAGGEKNIVSFMEKLGVDSLSSKNFYGAPLALGTGEMTPLELASAYSVFANLGVKKEISPILKIVDSKGNIVEEKKNNTGEKAISNVQAYINNSILSDTTTRPEFWNKYLTIPKRSIAVKTGTSTKQYIKNGKKDIYPANLWTVGYTPDITTVAWVGNTDGSKLNYKGNGLEGAGPIMRDFMTTAHEGKSVKTWEKPSGVKEINISEISGLLPNPESDNNNHLVKSLFINKPTKYDNSFKQIQIDALCNGKVTEATPLAAIKNVTLVELHSLNPSNPNWENPVKKWSKSPSFSEKYGTFNNLETQFSNKICERSGKPSKITIKSTIEEGEIFTPGENSIEFAYKSNNPIKKLDVLIDDEIVDEITLKDKLEGAYIGTFNIPKKFIKRKVNLKLRAVDTQYYSNTEEISIIIIEKDITPPEIILKNPVDGSIKLYSDMYFNLKADIKDRSTIRTINIKIDNKILKVGLTDKNLVFPINENNDLSIGNHTITIEAIDKDFNKTFKNVNLEILSR